MSSVISQRGVPTAHDATVAAKRLMSAYENIFVVLLHGSVARGEATEDSDIDLVAVFTDLDYANRRELFFELQNLAAGWGPFSVQVHPTDLPEWATRTTRVPCSFESHVMSGSTAVVAAGNAANGSAVWEKEQKLSSTNLDASLDYLWSYVRPKLDALSEKLDLTPRRVTEEELYPAILMDRMRRICEDSSMGVEVAIKTLATLRGEHPVTEKEMRKAGHDISKCLDQLSPPYRAAMTRIVYRQGLDLGSMSSWRIRATYPDDVDVNGLSAEEHVDDYILTVLSVTSAVISEFESISPANETRVADTRREWHTAADIYDTTDPRSGNLRGAPLGITDKLKSLNLGVMPGSAGCLTAPSCNIFLRVEPTSKKGRLKSLDAYLCDSQ